MLPNDYARCAEKVGRRCPSRDACQRATDQGTDPSAISYAAWQTRLDPDPEVAQEVQRIKRVVADLYEIAGES